jgi:hypothetical protein
MISQTRICFSQAKCRDDMSAPMVDIRRCDPGAGTGFGQTDKMRIAAPENGCRFLRRFKEIKLGLNFGHFFERCENTLFNLHNYSTVIWLKM